MLEGGLFLLDRVTIKRQARAILKGRQKPVLTSSILFVALLLVFSYLSYRLTMPSTEDTLRFADLFAAGDYEGAQRILASVQPTFLETLMSDLFSYLQAIVAFGFLGLLLNAVRGKEVAPGMLLDGFGPWIRVLLLELVSRLIITAGFFLLIIPGILALYNYRMARYLLLTRPEYGVLDCLRESRLRMRGHRWELFLLDLSFLGWALLSSIPILGIAALVWMLPYRECANLLYYEAVSASAPPAGEDPPLF